MRLIRRLSDYQKTEQGIAIAIGNFDGFHLGHQAVVNRMKKLAKEQGLLSAVMIFEPQPLEFFGKSVPPRIFALRDKLKAFAKAGVDLVFCISFNINFASLSDKEFVNYILRDTLNVKTVTVGSLFSFGKNGIYTFSHLKNACEAVGIHAEAIMSIASMGIRVSSTMIRAFLQSGDLESVRNVMGRYYSISGKVVHGNALGRTIGFPTANVNLNRKVCPIRGVFAVMVKTSYGTFKGVCNVGFRPTIFTKQIKSLLEVNLFDFNKDLYGQEIEVFFVKKIRDEAKFPSLELLMQQIKSDSLAALDYLNNKNI